MGVVTDFRVVSADNRQMWLPHDWQGRANKRVIVWCHGAAGNYAPGPVEKLLVHSGFPLICSDLGGGETWGSDASMTAITTAWTWAKDNFGVKTDKMLIWGGSMGSYTALQYLKENPANVAAVGAALPGVNPEDIRANDRLGRQSEIEAVHGIGTVPTAKNPSQNTAAYNTAAVPIKLWHSPDDTAGQLADTEAFDSAVSVCTLKSLVDYAGHPGGHSYLVMAVGANAHDIVQFLRPYIA